MLYEYMDTSGNTGKRLPVSVSRGVSLGPVESDLTG